MILTLGTASLIAVHASMPPRLGIRTSIRTMSGVVSTVFCTASAPSLGLADDVDVGLLLEHHLQPAPEQRVVVDDENADGLTAGYGRWLSTVGRLGHEISMSSQAGSRLATRLAALMMARRVAPYGAIRPNRSGSCASPARIPA